MGFRSWFTCIPRHFELFFGLEWAGVTSWLEMWERPMTEHYNEMPSQKKGKIWVGTNCGHLLNSPHVECSYVIATKNFIVGQNGMKEVASSPGRKMMEKCLWLSIRPACPVFLKQPHQKSSPCSPKKLKKLETASRCSMNGGTSCKHAAWACSAVRIARVLVWPVFWKPSMRVYTVDMGAWCLIRYSKEMVGGWSISPPIQILWLRVPNRSMRSILSPANYSFTRLIYPRS